LTFPVSASLAGGLTTTPRTTKAQFGPAGDYTTINTGAIDYQNIDPLTPDAIGIVKGFAFLGGIFSTDVFNINTPIGFRCVYRP